MKHKHSPNFFENEYEARTATNNRASTFFWTVVTVALFLLGFLLTSCNEISTPDYAKNNDYNIVNIDGCEYIKITQNSTFPVISLTHKGNCKNCTPVLQTGTISVIDSIYNQ